MERFVTNDQFTFDRVQGTINPVGSSPSHRTVQGVTAPYRPVPRAQRNWGPILFTLAMGGGIILLGLEALSHRVSNPPAEGENHVTRSASRNVVVGHANQPSSAQMASSVYPYSSQSYTQASVVAITHQTGGYISNPIRHFTRPSYQYHQRRTIVRPPVIDHRYVRVYLPTPPRRVIRRAYVRYANPQPARVIYSAPRVMYYSAPPPMRMPMGCSFRSSGRGR